MLFVILVSFLTENASMIFINVRERIFPFYKRTFHIQNSIFSPYISNMTHTVNKIIIINIRASGPVRETECAVNILYTKKHLKYKNH